MMPSLAAGTVLAEKFRIERVLGQGNMGVVVLATHLQLDQQVALKFLLSSVLAQPELEARFAQEARAAARIKSEHVARVIDVSTLDDGTPYIVMEYLEGTDLARQLKREGPFSAADAVLLVLQAGEALAEAHAAGIVHRDLKLPNLFLASYPDGAPCVKVLDFGISKYSIPGSDPDLSMTSTAAVMGSPLYMSPEQMRSTRSVDARADIWALGVILYELVSGHLPFDAQTMPLLCSMVLQDDPPPLAEYVRDLPPGFELAVLRCLAKDRAQRYQNVAELAQALAPFAPAEAQRSLQRIARISGSKPPQSTGRGAVSEPGHPGEQSPFAATVRPLRGGWAAGAVLALIGVALVLVFWRSGGAAVKPSAAPEAPAPAAAPAATSAPLPAAPTTAAPSAPAAPTAAPPPSTGAPSDPTSATQTAPTRRSAHKQRRSAKGAGSVPAGSVPASNVPTGGAPAVPAPAAPSPPNKLNPLDGRL